MSIHLQEISVSLSPSLNFPSTKSHHLECSEHSSKWEGRLPTWTTPTNHFLYCIPIVVIEKKKRSDQKNLREERIYLMYTFRSHSIAEGRQGKLSSRNWIHKSWRNSACCLPCQIVVSWLSYTAQGHLHWGWCQPRWSGSFYTNWSHDSSPQTCLQTSLTWANPPSRLPSQMARGCVRWTIKANFNTLNL